MFRTENRALCAAVSAVACTMLSNAALVAQERHTISTSAPVAIYNLAGEVRVLSGTGSDVIVEITRGGDEGSKLRVEKSTIGARNTLRVIYPDDDILYPGLGRGLHTQLRVNRDGTFYNNEDDDGYHERGRGDGVDISGRGRGAEMWADMTVRVPEGKTVAVYLGAGRMSASGVNAKLALRGGPGPISADNMRGALFVHAGSGHIEVRSAQGEVELMTGSGGVDVSDVRGTSLTVGTGSGGVEAADVQVARAELHTGSGGITARSFAAPDLEANAGSGRVELGLTSDVRSLNIRTGSGGVRVRMPQNVGATIDIDTGSGGIDTEGFEVVTQRHRRNHLSGKIGNGAGRIEISTGSGGVRLSST
jgi:lia operon protein LiaG